MEKQNVRKSSGLRVILALFAFVSVFIVGTFGTGLIFEAYAIEFYEAALMGVILGIGAMVWVLRS